MNMRTSSFAPVLLLALASACGSSDPNAPNRSETGEKWFKRAQQSYKTGDADDASIAIDGAIKASPKDRETRVLAAKIALAKLDYENVIKVTEGITGSDVHGLRGRAYWYSGDIEKAADELEEVGRDPNMKDNWARDVASLARRGHGRHPFQIEGVVSATEMPSGEGSPALVVPCELEGERILALVSTNFGELMVDSGTRKEPAWVNLRFGDKFEVKDVPALTHDLSGISRQLGATIKALIGVNVLRHVHATFDRHGSQFVVRKADPSPPPDAARVPVFYARGGAMMVRASVTPKEENDALLFVDSASFYPMALDDGLLKKTGADTGTWKPQPGAPAAWRMGSLPYFKLGNMDLSQFPAVQGASFSDYKNSFDVDMTGGAGAGLLSIFRVTFANDGKFLWLELDPAMSAATANQPPPPPAQQGPDALPPPGKAPPTKPAPAGPAAPPKSEPKTAPPPAATPNAKPATESKGAAK